MRPLRILRRNSSARAPCKQQDAEADAPGKVFLALFLDFDVQQEERVHPEVRVLAHAIVEAVRSPRIGEEDEGDGLAEVVQLQTARANCVHDGRVVYDAGRDAERACTEEDVRMRRRTEGIADDEESDILSVRISQDLVALRLDHVTVREDKRLPIKLFLYESE